MKEEAQQQGMLDFVEKLKRSDPQEYRDMVLSYHKFVQPFSGRGCKAPVSSRPAFDFSICPECVPECSVCAGFCFQGVGKGPEALYLCNHVSLYVF